MPSALVLKGTAKQYELTQPAVARRLSEGGLVFIDYILPGKCNFSCQKCFSSASTRYDTTLANTGAPAHDITEEQRRTLIQEAHSIGARTMLIAGAGEPTLSRQLDDLVSICSELKDMNLVVFTNGSTITKDGLIRYFSNGASLIFSIDASTEKSFNLLTTTRGMFKRVFHNLEDALEVASDFEELHNGVRVTRVAVNTTPTLVTYNPTNGVDEIAGIHNLIEGRAPHYVTRLTPFGNAIINQQLLVGIDRSGQRILNGATQKYGSGALGTSFRADGQCAALNNGIATYKGYWLLCPDAGFGGNHGRFPEVSVTKHWREKKQMLSQFNPPCIVNIKNEASY